MEDSEIIQEINGIYDRFETPPSLRMHMFRVAAVGDMICQNWKNDSIRINRDEIVAACLLHDLGNIAKMGMRKEEELRMMGGEAVN
ncbi:MAG: HD domain-containing protein, partial [Candidatus Micrarchaeota archaeon]|nr:HD domain-containing protein [Candidatus Micrarchaeota archaeon]